MPWSWTRPATNLSVGALAGFLSDQLQKLQRLVQCYEPVAVLTYGTTVQVGGELSRIQLITVTDAVNFTIANPRTPREGAEIVLDIFNNTAGVIGTITFGSEYQTAGAFVKPAAGKHKLIAFYRARDSKWRETWRGAADI
jgi:hypothetical protein